MKSFLWVAAVLALFSTVSAEKDVSGCMKKCPPVNPDPKDVYFVPHRNCSQFCSCVYGTPFVVDCPPGLHYSPAKKVCTWQHEANCTTAGQNRGSITLLTVRRESFDELDSGCIGICPGTDIDQLTATLEHQDCNKFCKCVRGRPYVHECPEDFHYTPVLGICTHQDEAKCTRWTTPNPNPSPPHGWCPCPEPTKPTDPSTEPTKPTYPSTEPTKPTYPSTEPTKPTDPSTEPTEPTDPPTKPTRPPTKPTRPPTEPTRPPTNPTKPTRPPTKPTEPTRPPTKPTRPPPPLGAEGCIGKCPRKDPVTVKHLAHEHCSKFCKCNRGTPVLIPCPNGLYFNPQLEVCDLPGNSGCTGITD